MYVKREIKRKFEKIKDSYNIIAVVGARQSGKTTFLKEQIKSINADYLLFDDPDIRELFESDIKKFEKQYLNQKISIFDEIQNCKDAGPKLKYLADSGYKIWITSSSEIILGKEILSYLVGRVSVLKLYPFSFKEFLSAKKQKAMTTKIEKRLIWEHLTYGGYPKAVLSEDIELKKIILSDLQETMLLKDVAQTFSIDDVKSLEKMIIYLANNAGIMITYNSAANIVGLSFPTIKKYLEALEKSYLIKFVSPYFKNKNKEISKQPKIYFIDTGLRNSITKTFKPKINGRMFENYVFTELIKAGFTPKYWRTKAGAEADFIIESKNSIIPIECKLKSDSVKRSFRSFIDTYNPSNGYIVNYEGITKKLKINNCEVLICGIRELIEKLKKT
ncbi:AAA family ATPase [Candidatus Woesearchaeota archaeon]|nr:AAA family ATPase [Candidatus Woesearchaeota archaeon]